MHDNVKGHAITPAIGEIVKWHIIALHILFGPLQEGFLCGQSLLIVISFYHDLLDLYSKSIVITVVSIQVPRNVQFSTHTRARKNKSTARRDQPRPVSFNNARNLRILLALEIEHFRRNKKMKQTFSRNSLYSSTWGGWSWQLLISITGENETFFLIEFRELLISIDYRGFT